MGCRAFHIDLVGWFLHFSSSEQYFPIKPLDKSFSTYENPPTLFYTIKEMWNTDEYILLYVKIETVNVYIILKKYIQSISLPLLSLYSTGS